VLDEIPADEQLLLRRAIRALPDGNVRRLESNPRRYRLQVEGTWWRVILEVDRRRKRITVLLVARREAGTDPPEVASPVPARSRDRGLPDPVKSVKGPSGRATLGAGASVGRVATNAGFKRGRGSSGVAGALPVTRPANGGGNGSPALALALTA